MTFLELLVIKNLNLDMLTKLQQYLSCLYIGHANKNGIHPPQKGIKHWFRFR